MPDFETILTLAVIAGLLYLGYKVWIVASEAYESIAEWLFGYGSHATIRRFFYLILIAIFSAAIYYYGFYWWMIPCLLVPFIACWTLDGDGDRRKILGGILLWFVKWTAISGGAIVVLFYIFSDVSILEVGIGGFFLALWEMIIGVGKFVLSALGILLLISLFGGGGGRSSSSSNSGTSESDSYWKRQAEAEWENNKAIADRMEERRGEP